jgi:hypothetical protein
MFNKNNTCKYCYDSGNLISPCNCLGSIKYVHQDCLYKWISNKYINFELGKQINVSCELCRKNYDLIIEQYSPLYISPDIKNFFIILIMYFVLFYLIIAYSIYIYCLEMKYENCDNIKIYNSFALLTVSISLNLIYLQCFFEEYTKKIKIRLC